MAAISSIEGSSSSGMEVPHETPLFDKVEAYMKTFTYNGPPPFEAAFHYDRRVKLLEQLPLNCAVIVIGGSEKSRNADVMYPFRQESDFHYLTGFDEPDSLAVLEKKVEGPRFTLIVPPKDPEKETWTGKRAGVRGAKEVYGADVAYPNDNFSESVIKVCREASKVFVVPATSSPECNRQVTFLLASISMPPTNCKAQVHAMRKIKTAYEIALIKKANFITRCAHASAMRMGKLTRERMWHSDIYSVGRNEAEIQAYLELEMKKRGGVRVAYPSIVASGANATILHYTENDAYAMPGDLVLIDAGVEYGSYASDVTRTWPLSGRFLDHQKELYLSVLEAQEQTIKQVRPGITMQELHLFSLKIIAGHLIDLGILEGDIETLIADKSVEKYTIHKIGHPMGLDVHDLCDDKLDWFNEPLQTGMVITIEPGIYIVKDDKSVDPKWRGIGIRLEDNIVVTETGFENLTAAIPKDPAAISALMN